MKLDGLKSTPNLYRGDIEDCVEYIRAVRNSGPLDFADYFHADVAKYLNECVAKSKVISKHSSVIVDYTVRLDPTGIAASVSIYTAKSNLSDVKAFVKAGLNTRSPLAELRGRNRTRRNEYDYYLPLDISTEGDLLGVKSTSNGIFRLVVLVHLLAKALKENGVGK